MTALGIALLLVGAALVVAEAHLPGGVLGVLGGLALVAGGVIAIAAQGGSIALAVPVGLGLGAAAGAWALLVARKATATRRARIAAGAPALLGRVGVVRSWAPWGGHVFVEGALWRARLDDWPMDEHEHDARPLHAGDAVVIEGVSGLTLRVRRAERWELIA